MKKWFNGFLFCIFGAMMLIIFMYGVYCIYNVFISPTITGFGILVLGLLLLVISNMIMYVIGDVV